MKVTINWLKDFVDIDVTARELADKLVGVGFEVEEIIDPRENIKNVVLGKILSIEKHPDADKLVVCQIDVGSEILQIVTGAHNIAEGDLVPVAKDNSCLPGGKIIKKGKLRGVESCGMLCSGEELGLSEADYEGAGVYGILIMNKEAAPLGTDINDVLGNDDVVLDIGVTANRPDCNSVYGIAGEVAAVLKKPLRAPKLDFRADSDKKIADIVSVRVDAPDICPRYMAAAVTDIKIAPSPEYVRKRLKAVGLRPINNMVDITNYVLIEMGQPMHAFDDRDICGGKIIARRAKEGEKIVTLDGKEYSLSDNMLVIADEEKANAVAGVMGGMNSGIREDTSMVVFESARFVRDSVRRTSRSLGLRSDSSARFEKGVDFSCQPLGLRRALALVQEFGCGKIAQGVIDVCTQIPEKKPIVTTPEKIDRILGIDIDNGEKLSILNALGIKSEIEGGNLICVPPEARDDLESANDIAEEIIRYHGYYKISGTLMDKGRQTMGGKTRAVRNEDKIKEIAVSCGMHETLTYSFISPSFADVLRLPEDSKLRRTVEIINPLGEDMSVMRTQLAYSMIGTLASNILKSQKAARMFEIASVYLPKGEIPITVQPEEQTHIVLGAYGKDENFYTIKGVVELILKAFGIDVRYARSGLSYLHPGRSADLMKGNKSIGYVGEVHPAVCRSMNISERIYIAELNIDLINKYEKTAYKFEAISKFPPVERDIAVVVDEDVSGADILDAVKKAGGAIMREADIFDVYRSEAIGKGKKSVAVNMVFRADDRTLTDEDIAEKTDKILSGLKDKLGAELR